MGHNFERFCKDYENIENYQKAKADNFKGWQCHHRLETWNSDGERRTVDITADELESLGMYYNRPPEELIFLTRSEHIRLHHKGKPKPKSNETRKKLSEACKGKHHTEETKKKLSEALKGKYTGENSSFYGKHHTEDVRRKMSEDRKGMHWFNNGKINARAKECPDGFTPGRLR